MLRKMALLLLFALLNPPGIAAQDLNKRSERMVGLGQVIISDQALPDRVFQAQKHKIIVQVTLIAKNDPTFRQSSMGTGTILGAGIILTNRHVLDGAKTAMEEREYAAVFSGIILAETNLITIPLNFIGVGEVGTFRDFMVFQVGVEIMQRASQPNTLMEPNPYRILINDGMDLVDEIGIGEKVYLTGYSPVLGELKDANGRTSAAYIDFINYTFPAEVVAKIEEMPMNRVGRLKRLYRLKDGAEPGFSGGMVLDERGRLIGITVSLSPAQNFVYVLSAEDVKDFLRANKVRVRD